MKLSQGENYFCLGITKELLNHRKEIKQNEKHLLTNREKEILSGEFKGNYSLSKFSWSVMRRFFPVLISARIRSLSHKIIVDARQDTSGVDNGSALS